MSFIIIFTIIFMIISIVYSKTIKIFKQHYALYWIIGLSGSLVLVLLNSNLLPTYFDLLFENTTMNPIKILILFLSFSAISLYLDDIGFIAYLASKTVAIAGHDQRKLFLYFYVLVSFLTIFTANDIVILTLTPFIIYFSKNAKINPFPFLIMQFVAANTWSMLLIIGNPTNIYMATSFGITFIEYLTVMTLPTVVTGLLSYFILVILFYKNLSQKIVFQENASLPNRGLSVLGIIHLIGVTLMMAIAPYLGFEMYLIAFFFVISLFISHQIFIFWMKDKKVDFKKTIFRLPWSLVPFFLSMVFMIHAFDDLGWLPLFMVFLSSFNQDWIYGLSSFLVSNLINNIPMSILFTNILSMESSSSLQAGYASSIGSNLGAIFTPIGALAGMMWMSIIKRFEITIHFYDFLRYGFIIGLPLLAISLFSLQFVV